MEKYYWFSFTGDDPMRTKYKESETSIEEMRKRFVGEWIQTGDEEHDAERVADIITEDEARAYFR